MKELLRTCVVWLVPLLFASGCGKPIAAPAAGQTRVVSLAPSLTEIVSAVGGLDELVGRTSACDYPPEAAKVPVIGGFGTPSLEQLVASSPTVILEMDLEDKTVAQKIKSLGLNLQHVECTYLDDIPPAIARVGTLISHPEHADRLATDLKNAIAQLRSRAAMETNRPSVYVEIWKDPYMTACKDSFLSELVYLAGGNNIGDEIGKDYSQVSSEWIVTRDPDIIICFYMSEGASAAKEVMNRTGWQTIKAIRNGNVYDGFDNNLILRPGPRVLLGIEALRQCINRGSP